MVNLTYLTKYPTKGATSRYRSYAFAFRLADQNYNIEIQSFMDMSYLENLFTNRPKKMSRIFLCYIERFFALFRSSDNLIIERELFPFLPYFVERFFLKNKRYILDFDDNVWETYRGNKWLVNKYDELIKNASGVIVGNHYLEEYVGKFNSNVIKIPTVINLENYHSDSSQSKFERFSLVWIGSPITYRYIEGFASVFQNLSQKIDFDLIVIASKALVERAIPGVSMKFYDWSNENEAYLLKQSHIGIMPLTDDPFSQGKSGFKLIQYQAAGLPSIASPVGENCFILQEGFNGFLPKEEQDWIDAILHLYRDDFLYSTYSSNALQNAYNYSIQKYFPIYKEFIHSIFKDTP